MIIQKINAREVKDSRNEPTICVSVVTSNGLFETSTPSGKSVGKNEAKPFSRKGLKFSIDFAKVLGKKLFQEKIKFENFGDLKKLEELIRRFDKSKDWKEVGGNTVFAIEASILKALAYENNQELYKFLLGKNKLILPKPLGNCIGGGKHLSSKQKYKPDIQEFLLLPETKHFFDSYFINLQAHKKVKSILLQKDKEWRGFMTDENAYSPTLTNEKILNILVELRGLIKSQFGVNLKLGLDVASSSFYSGGFYHYNNFSEKTRQRKMTNVEQIYYILDLIERYRLFYVEDPLYEESFSDYKMLMEELRKKSPNILICGDDLICTQVDRIKKAIQEKAINSVIIKPNQNGSLLETKKVVDLALKNKIVPVMSHRSGETLDTTISHLAVGWGIPIIKTGITGKERLAKLKELLRIEKSFKS